MGVAVSRYSELSSNELLMRFCSSEVICPNDPFWNQLLAFNINPPASAEEQLMFDGSTESLLQKFLQNNPQTGNLGSLVQVFITRATELLAAPNSDKLKPRWILFPNTEPGRQTVATGYQRKFGLPDILGAIDCTHVQLFPPPKPQQAQFRNRHGVTSINVQLIADAECKILNVNANFPGRVHDQFIFNTSIIKTELRRLHELRIGQYYLLGDSGYALEPWLMTPVRNAQRGTPEDRYTKWHCQTRNVIERTNGYLKGTFRCLGIDRSLHYAPEKASALVYACCTLYNIMQHYSVMLAWQTFNALFVIRAVSKYLVEMVPEFELCRHLDVQAERRVGNGPVENRDGLDNTPSQETSPPLASPATPDAPEPPTSPKLTGTESRVEMLIDALIGLIIDVPVTDNTYYLHLECINTMLVLMSVYMFAGVHGQTRLVDTSLIYRTLFQGRYGMHAPLLVKTLLNNLSSMLAAPPSMFVAHPGGGSLLINLASGLWNMITFNSTSRQTIYTNPPLDRQELQERVKKEHPVANQSCLLLLTLANHCMNDDNLYRNALLCCEDTAETSAPTPQKESNGGSQLTPPRIDMAALHKALCATAGCEHSTLLLYLMLHSCNAYKRHISNVAHIDQLIVPILQVLYNAPDNNNHHIYMSLIVLLILTEDDALIKSVHLIMLKNLTWYTERAISEISLGGLMVLVILRALQYNMVRVRDKYLHTNCLAAIANMSCEFRNLHPYVAQRLISLFETLTKRRARLCSEIEGGDINSLELPHHLEEKTEEIMDHISVLDEVLRMLLEIINSCVAHQLSSNSNVVYALLHKRHLFTQHTHHPVAQNIDMVIGYFSTRLQRVQEGAGGDLGVTEVLQCIKKGAEQWSSDRLKKFPDLKFRYVEEERPEEFFTPYVWSLVNSCGGVYWASEGGARALGDLLAC